MLSGTLCSHSSSPNLNLIFVFALAISCCLCVFSVGHFGWLPLHLWLKVCTFFSPTILWIFPTVSPLLQCISALCDGHRTGKLWKLGKLEARGAWKPVENICPWVLRLVQRACRWPLLHLSSIGKVGGLVVLSGTWSCSLVVWHKVHFVAIFPRRLAYFVWFYAVTWIHWSGAASPIPIPPLFSSTFPLSDFPANRSTLYLLYELLT